MMIPRNCLIGIGSPHGDDQVGWCVVDELRSHLGVDAAIHKLNSPLEILDWIDGTEWLGICDACQGIGAVGEWHKWTWPDDALVIPPFSGSHDFGLTATLKLAATLGRLPATVMIWGIQIEACLPEDSLSRIIRDVVPVVADAMLQALSKSGKRNTDDHTLKS